MDSLTPNQIENIHNRILPHFNSRDGNFYQNVDNVLELAPEVDRTDFQCIMNPNFRSIHRKYHNDPKYVAILKKFGQCVYNNFLPDYNVSFCFLRNYSQRSNSYKLSYCNFYDNSKNP